MVCGFLHRLEEAEAGARWVPGVEDSSVALPLLGLRAAATCEQGASRVGDAAPGAKKRLCRAAAPA